MADFSFNAGDLVKYLDQEYIVKSAINLQKILIVDPIKELVLEVNVSDLQPIFLKNDRTTRELSLIAEQDWKIAKRREKILKPLTKNLFCTIPEAKKVSKKLGLKQRQLYNLLKNYRESGYKLLSLVPKMSDGGKGRSRINKPLERIIREVIKKMYLKNQRIKASVIIETVKLSCFNEQLSPPSDSTILRRLKNCGTEKEIMSKRLGAKAAKGVYSEVKGKFPQQGYPLQTYQICG